MKKTLATITSIILFIEFIDITILYSCVVPIAHQFGVNPAKMSLPILTFVTGTCILIPMVSWLAHRYNRIHLIMLSLFAFAVFSFLCGIENGLYLFSIWRFFQGIAISLCAAIASTTLLSLCTSEEMVKTMATINIPGLLGTALGPFIGAVFSYYLSWRIAFFINVPLCLLLIFFLMPLKNKLSTPDLSMPLSRFDGGGFIIVSSFLILVSIGFEESSHAINLLNTTLVVVGLMLGAMYVWRWCQGKQTLLDLKVFSNPNFLFGAVVNVIARSAMTGISLLTSLVLQQAYGYSILKSSGYLALIASAALMAKFFSSILTQLGLRKSVMVFACCTAFSILNFSYLSFWASHPDLLWIPCVSLGASMSLLYTSMNSILYISIPTQDMPNAINIGNIIQQFSTGLGIVMAVGGLQILLSWHGLQMISENKVEIVHFYELLCQILASVMMINPFIALPFRRSVKALTAS